MSVYTITWHLVAFSLVIDRDLLKDIHWWRQIRVRSRQKTCFSFLMPRKSFNKPFEFLLYKKNRLHFSMCMYCIRSQMTLQRVKNNSHATRLRVVSYFSVSLYTLWRHLWSITVHTRKNVIYLLSIYCTVVYYDVYNMLYYDVYTVVYYDVYHGIRIYIIIYICNIHHNIHQYTS